jgi:rhodanese-related sulfurtransferase
MAAVSHISALELDRWLKDVSRAAPLLVDVREPWELERCRLAGATSMPMREILGRLDELDPEREIVVICHHGARSLAVANHLTQVGFEHVHNLTGGVDAWARQVDPAMPHY